MKIHTSSSESVSALIYTKDNPQKVIHIVDKIFDYVNEIIIIDSSSPDNYKKLLGAIGNKAKIFNLPALGIVEPFQKLGASLTKNEWILHLDDDELPSKELLSSLKATGNISGYLIPRLNYIKKNTGYRLRFYNKNKVQFSGIIHWGIIPKGEIKKMDLDKVLYHYEEPNFSKWKRYTIIEGYIWGYKILWIVNNRRWHIWNQERDAVAEIFSNLYKKIFILGKKIGWLLLSIGYLFTNIIYALRKMGTIKFRLMKIFYEISVFFNIIKNFDVKIQIWEELFKAGGLISYLGLNSIEDFKKLKERNEHGLDLLVSLIEKESKLKDDMN